MIVLFDGWQVSSDKNCARGPTYGPEALHMAQGLVLRAITKGIVFLNMDRPRLANNVFFWYF